MEVDVELRPGEQFEALAVRGHHAVFDAVVDHLHEVPGTARADVRVAIRRRQRLQHWFDEAHGIVGAADHQAVALLQAPDATARTRIDVLDAAGRDRLGAAHGVVVVRIASVDQDIALRQKRRQLGDRRVDGRAGRHHHPDRAARRQLFDELAERCRAHRPFGDRRRHRFGAQVRDDDAMAALKQPHRHIRAHTAQADHADVHLRSSPYTRGLDH